MKKAHCQIKLESKTLVSNLQWLFRKGTLKNISIVIFVSFTRCVRVIVLQTKNITQIHKLYEVVEPLFPSYALSNFSVYDLENGVHFTQQNTALPRQITPYTFYNVFFTCCRL